ncbi:hypothetical protein HY404_02685 [Candidatus Microgenomates bacterium]|nr:hypothetical protein [Candidatus Microgenomates bacterium]
MSNFVRANFYLILVFFLAFLLRVWWLNIFPIAITHDEQEYIMQAKSLFFTGQGIPTAPMFGLFSWGQQSSGNVLAELPSFLIAPIIGLFSSSQFIARLPYAFVSSLTVVIVYFIFSFLTKKKFLALLISLILALNPWSIHFGRTSFEFTFSVFFYLTGIYFAVKANKWSIFYALPFFTSGFLSYHGAKLLFFPLIALVCLWKYLDNRKIDCKPLLSLVTLALLISFSYFVTLKYQPSNARAGELVFYNSDIASSSVDNERKSAVPGFQQQIFLNKATYFYKRLTDTYLHTFSTDFLFVSGENRGAYSFWIHGLFYYIDFPLIILGLIGLYTISKRVWWLIVGIIAISPITSVLSGGEPSYVIRSGLIFPLLAALSGIGIWFLLNQLKRYRVFIGGAILIIYLFSVANFLNLYFTRYPIYNSEGFFFSNKVLSRYVDLNLAKGSATPIIISVVEPRIVFEKFLFYNNFYTKGSARDINQKIAQKDFSYKNIRFIDKCDQITATSSATYVYEAKMECNKQLQPTTRILSPVDAGSLFIIKNDKLCKSYNLSRYPRINKISEFNVYKLSEDDFCKIWISML